MTISERSRGAPVRRRGGLARSRIVALLLAWIVLTAGVLAFVMVQLRAGDIADAKKLLTAVAQLTDEQTSRTLQNVDQGLQNAEAIVAAASLAGTSANGVAINAEIQKLVADRPYLMVIRVLDTKGRVVYSSDTASTGVDLSDRAYFTTRRDSPGKGFQLDAPIRGRMSNGWIIPAARTMRAANGDFAGVVVAAVDPMFFARVWTLDEEIPTISMTLFRSDGVMLMRVPFSEKLIGTSYNGEYVFRSLRAGDRTGTFQNTSSVDGRLRIFAYRQLTAYPDLVLVVGQALEQVLVSWWHIVRIVVFGWAVATLALAALAVWLVREWAERMDSQTRYRTLFDASPYPMVVTDRQTRAFLDVNDAAVAEYGWSRSEALTMTANDLYSVDDQTALTAMRREDPSTFAKTVKGFRHRRKDGSVFDVEMHTRSIELNGISAILTASENVTARNLAEEQLRQSQKMEAVGQLTGGIAHDFNNILTVILANADAVQEEENVDPAVAARLDQIGQAVLRASELTHQLLAFSRKAALNPKRTDLNDLVFGIGKLLHRALGEHIEIHSILADDLWTVNVDRAQLETALVNLAVNARDAMPGGGKLRITTRNVTLDMDNVTQATDVLPGDYTMIEVTDTGIGMSAATRAKVFEPFFTTKEVGKGTGLGLSMVYGFIKQSSGHITIHSELGRGTTFRLYLPRSDGVQDVEVARPAGKLPHGTERVLVVEDEPQVRAAVVQQLRSLGYTVSEAIDGTAGLAAFEDVALPYQLLLTDLVMPGPLNGRSLAKEVLRRWPATRVVCMSGYARDIALHDDQPDACALVLGKPFRKRDLAQIVRQALDAIVPVDTRPEAA